MTEQWRPISGYEGYYEASDQGRIRRVKATTNTWSGRVLKPSSTPNGYVKVTLSRDNHKGNIFVHKVIAGVFHGERPSGYQINHRNGNKKDNRVTNLEYVTQSENSYHAYRVLNVNRAVGEETGQSKITSADVVSIFKKLADGKPPKDIAEQYNVSAATIGDIKFRRTWAHVDISGELVSMAKSQKPHLSRGIKNCNSKLNPEKVRKIRELRESGYSAYRIAKMYGVTRRTIQQVHLGITWRHVA